MAKARQRQPKSPDVKKDKGGRPTSFQASFVELGYKYALLGLTDVQMADLFGVAKSTLELWKLKHPKFSDSLKRGKSQADAVIAHSLFHRAQGYSHKAVKILQHEGSSYEHEYTEHYPPDATAAIFWLKNRQPELWRDKQQHEHGGPNGGPIEVADLTVEDLKRIAAARGLLPKR